MERSIGTEPTGQFVELLGGTIVNPFSRSSRADPVSGLYPLCLLWWTAEFTRSSLRDKEPVSDSDKGTSRLWDARHLIAVIGMAVGFTHI